MSFLETPAGRALVELEAGRTAAAREILIAGFEKDLKGREGLKFCRIQNLIQHGMIKEAKDALRREMFAIPKEVVPYRTGKVNCESSCYAGGLRSSRANAFNGQ